MTEIVVRGVTFTLDDEDMPLIQGGNLHIRRGGHNREDHRYLYVRWGGVGKPEFSVARLVLGLGHNDRTLQADHLDRDTTNNQRSNLRIVTPQQQAENHAGWSSDFCVRGHPRDVSMRTMVTGRRYCLPCSNERSRRYRATKGGRSKHT